ncbi:(2Fe-2S)-binding protein [Streptomyces sp. JJ66]|uniref:(2Fe-2S)-binding protein n=1 Tax=Streptomyces sp. JJ66 TaxID=2803843 RepID=UPI001C56D357|nr:(2Fe-2S)-binding protein [Streptomyces sp. JJ66]MBW1604635.1 (2Fe-2S)-binding protein [Streptomyces sp. JJ66]
MSTTTAAPPSVPGALSGSGAPTGPGAPSGFDALVAEVYARFGAGFPLLRITTTPVAGEGWLTGQALAQDAALREQLVSRQGERMRAAKGAAPRRDVAALEVLHQYAFIASLAMSAPWYLEQRVPQLAPGGVGYHEGRGLLTLAPHAVSCLPGDPAASVPGVRVVPDAQALRAELRSAVAAHLAPVLAAFGPLLRRGPRGLWGVATDELADGLGYLGDLLGDRAGAAAAANLLLPGDTPPFAGAAGFPLTDGDAGCRTRLNCCLYYTFEGQPLCAGCPRQR